MIPQFEIQRASIVLRGAFNHEIFHPVWFASRNLIKEQEAEAVKELIIQQRVAIFKTDWLDFQAVEDRLLVASQNEAFFEMMRDFIIGTFILLNQTPLRVMGINCAYHIRLSSKEMLDNIGNIVAPKEPWNKLLKNPGLTGQLMEEPRIDDIRGYLRVKIGPSGEIQNGLFIDFNDHYELETNRTEFDGVSRVIEILKNRWDDSMQRFRLIASGIVELGGNE
ncbi:MAG: hypothetical protein JXA42_04870 [Anaerolineales bacterium]|nr:hypothetical protein [Anaerolineales bacterium]